MNGAAVMVYPSLYEGFGLPPLEAMACGTAVVASHVGGIPEVVADGQTGLLVPPDEPQALTDALNTLARDPERANAMGEAGRQRAISDFDWTSIASQTAKLYHEVAESTAKRADA